MEMSKNKISSLLVVVAILALVLVPSIFAGCENNDGNIQLPSKKDEDAAAIIDKRSSLTDSKLPRTLLRGGDHRQGELCNHRGAPCTRIGSYDDCCPGCSCMNFPPVTFCDGSCSY